MAPAAGRIPGLYRAMFAVMRRSRQVHLATGTVVVTAVGMFADGGGFAISPPTLPGPAVVRRLATVTAPQLGFEAPSSSEMRRSRIWRVTGKPSRILHQMYQAGVAPGPVEMVRCCGGRGIRAGLHTKRRRTLRHRVA